MKRLAFAALLLSAALPLLAQKRPFTIEDLYRVQTVSDLSLAPDGRSLVYVVTTPDLPRAKRASHVWTMNVDGSNAHALTNGDADSTPVLSPDGRTLAFLRDGNLWLLPLGGGEARKLTDISTGVADPVWSPDGKWIAFATDVYPECNGDAACNKRVGETWSNGKLKAHMADNTLLYRHWTAWKDGTVTHLWLANVESGATRDLTPGRYDFPPFQLGGGAQYDFAPDSSEIAVVSNHDAKPASSTNADVWLLSLTSPNATPRNVTASNPAYDGAPKYSPDGRYVAYRMQKIPTYESDKQRLAIYDRQSGTSTVLTESFADWVEDFSWARDSKSLFLSAPVQGHNPIYRVSLGGGAIEKLYDDRTIDHFETANDGRTIYYIGRSVGEPTEIYSATLGSAGTTRRRLSHVNDALANAVDIRPAEMMWVTGADGAKVQYFVVKPHDFDPAKKYPLIVNVHGGPQQQWADAFRGDWQVYPGAGYVVAFPNPHGSTGFGQDFTAAISGDWGGKPFEDVMKVTDALAKLPYVDANRMGLMGWSYGGYFVDWAEGHTDRFKAAASMMGLYDLRSFYGATEESWFPEWDLKGQPWNSELYEKFSPSNYVKNFKTPCLVISGERDYRVPYTQSLQFYTALQKMNVPSRLIIFSEAGHWPSWYEMALYYTAHLEWFHQYLGGGAPPWTTDAFLRNAVFNTATGERVPEEKNVAKDEKKAPENSQGKPDAKPQ